MTMEKSADTEQEIIRIKLSAKYEMPIMGIKIIEHRYGSAFLSKGELHFSNSREWSDEIKYSNYQCDIDEGLFCLSKKDQGFQSMKPDITQ